MDGEGGDNSIGPRQGFRGVHRAIICGKVGLVPVQKLLRNGRTITVFTVGTGGMWDQMIEGDKNLPMPPQWHRIAVHNDNLGAFAVQKLVKNSSVYVEGDIETRVYNDSANNLAKIVPEICVQRNDFTPSHGSKPNYQPRTQTVMTNVFQTNNILSSKSSEPSLTGRRKIAELLQESMHNGSEKSTDITNNESNRLSPLPLQGSQSLNPAWNQRRSGWPRVVNRRHATPGAVACQALFTT